MTCATLSQAVLNSCSAKLLLKKIPSIYKDFINQRKGEEFGLCIFDFSSADNDFSFNLIVRVH